MASTPKSIIPATVNPDLQKERDGASFSSEEFAAWWAKGEDVLKFNREVRAYMQKDVDQGEMLQLQAKSHVEINEFSQRGAIEAAQKLRRLQQERNPGGDDYWPKLVTVRSFLGAQGWPGFVSDIYLLSEVAAERDADPVPE